MQLKVRHLIIAGVLSTGILGGAYAGTRGDWGDGGWGHHHRGYGSCEGDGYALGGHWRHMFDRLGLSEQQRDKVFDIVHAQEPAVRDKMKEVRKNRDALREAATGTGYDEGHVRALAEQQAKLRADLIVMRMESFHTIYGLLDDKQKEKLSDMRKRYMKHYMD